jgi:spectinomycin phosphotransferase
VVRDEPTLNADAIPQCLLKNYGIKVDSQQYLSLGYDFEAFVYEIITEEKRAYFLKIRNGAPFEPGLDIPRALNEQGIDNIPAPFRTHENKLWCWLDETRSRSVVLYPFIEGENAMEVGLTDDQWGRFGASLRAIHDSGVETMFDGIIPRESFSLPSVAVVRDVLARV